MRRGWWEGNAVVSGRGGLRWESSSQLTEQNLRKVEYLTIPRHRNRIIHYSQFIRIMNLATFVEFQYGKIIKLYGSESGTFHNTNDKG